MNRSARITRLNQETCSAWRASAVGVYRLWRDSGYAVGALIAGIVADAVGLRGAILTIAALTAASGLTPGLARVQRVLDATVWPTVGAGCHAHRDTRTAIEQAGFTIKDLEQLRIPETTIPGPTSPHILGAATMKEG
jgi:MFS family permease